MTKKINAILTIGRIEKKTIIPEISYIVNVQQCDDDLPELTC